MNTSNALRNTHDLYHAVISDVVNSVREAFVDEGVDESVLKDFRELWHQKLAATKVIDPQPSSHRMLSSSHMLNPIASSMMRTVGRREELSSTPKAETSSDANRQTIVQLDGPPGSSRSDDDVEDEFEEENGTNFEEDQVNDDEADDACQTGIVEEGDPLNSDDDDLVNENPDELFEAEDIVVCQYDKVVRSRSKWKFILKDGIMNLSGKEYVFNKALGESEF